MTSREGLYFSKRLRREETQPVSEDRVLAFDKYEQFFGRSWRTSCGIIRSQLMSGALTGNSL